MRVLSSSLVPADHSFPLIPIEVVRSMPGYARGR
jgi:hypothetical protein